MRNAFLSILLLSSLSLNAYSGDRTESEEAFQRVQNSIFQLDKSLTEKDFDASIKKKYHATYLFLDQLSKVQKQKVYEYYKTDSDFGNIRHKIFDLFFDATSK